MQQVCVNCGQAFEVDTKTPAGTATCPACGKSTPIGAPLGTTGSPWSRIKGRDVLIALVVLALLAALVLLFFKPKQPVRDLVYGDLGVSQPQITSSQIQNTSRHQPGRNVGKWNRNQRCCRNRPDKYCQRCNTAKCEQRDIGSGCAKSSIWNFTRLNFDRFWKCITTGNQFNFTG